MLLGEEGHEVDPPVPVEVGGRDVEGPRALVERRRDELRLLPVAGAVLEQQDPAPGEEAERGDHEIEVPVAVEVGRLHVGDAGELLGEDALLVGAVGLAPQPHHGALLVVLGHEEADVGDQQVVEAVAVEVDEGGPRRVRDLRDLAQLPGPAAGSPTSTSPWPMSQATISGRPSRSRSRSCVLATIGTGAAPGGLRRRRSKREAAGAGHGSGVGSASGARASK